MTSPIVLVDGLPTNSSISVAAGSTITVRLNDISGVASWQITCFSTSENYTAAQINSTYVLTDAANKIATFVVPNTPGTSFGFSSVVNGGVDVNGRRRADWSTTFKVYVPASNGGEVLFANETTEGGPFGWISPVNRMIRTGSSGGGGGTSGGADPGASYLVTSTTASLPNERALVAGTGLTSVDGGAGGNYTLSVKPQLTGSHTKTAAGLSAFVAGPGISITSGTTADQVTIANTATAAPVSAQYLALATDATLTAERVFTPGTGLRATDGGAGAAYTLNINDGVVATISGSTFTRISGSLQQTAGGVSYLVAQGALSITTQSNGQIIFSASGGSGGGVSVPGISTSVIFNQSSSFGGGSSFTHDPVNATTVVSSALCSLSIVLDDTLAFDANYIKMIGLDSANVVRVGSTTDVRVDTATTGTFTYFADSTLVLSASAASGIVAPSGLTGSLQRTAGGLPYILTQGALTVTTNSSGQLIFSASGGSGGTSTGGGDPGAQYLVLATTSSLTADRAFVPGTGLAAVDGGANGNYTLNVNTNVIATTSGSTFQKLTGSLQRMASGQTYIAGIGGVTVTTGSTGQVVVDGGLFALKAGAAFTGAVTNSSTTTLNGANTLAGATTISGLLTASNVLVSTNIITKVAPSAAPLFAKRNVVTQSITTGSGPYLAYTWTIPSGTSDVYAKALVRQLGPTTLGASINRATLFRNLAGTVTQDTALGGTPSSKMATSGSLFDFSIVNATTAGQIWITGSAASTIQWGLDIMISELVG